MNSKFHSGEIAVQTKAGVQDIAQRVSRVIGTKLPRNAQYFLEMQRMIVVGSLDESNNVQATVLIGNSGFVQAPDEKTIRIDATSIHDDGLIENLQKRNEIGILVIELAARLRLKIKGKAILKDSYIIVTIERAYGQCPKYIQAREVESLNLDSRAIQNIRHSESLSDYLQKFISVSDTFFIASYHEESGVDVSHRGGNPGFIRILNKNKLVFPDYPGNSMFNTLGNLSANPEASLLFIDFDHGDTYELHGEARIIWDEDRIMEFAGAERLVEFYISDVVNTRRNVPLKWQFLDYSPFNPA